MLSSFGAWFFGSVDSPEADAGSPDAEALLCPGPIALYSSPDVNDESSHCAASCCNGWWPVPVNFCASANVRMEGAMLMSEIRAHACAKSTTASCTAFHQRRSPLQTNRRMFARATWDRQRLICPCVLAQNCGLACVAPNQTHHIVNMLSLWCLA